MMKISSLRLVPLFLITELTLLWLPFPFDPPTFSLDLLISNRARAKGYKHSRCLWIFPEDLISIIGKGKQARKTRLTLANASNTNYKHVAYKEESNLSSRSLLLQNAYLIDFGPIKNIFFFWSRPPSNSKLLYVSVYMFIETHQVYFTINDLILICYFSYPGVQLMHTCTLFILPRVSLTLRKD